MDKRSSWGDVGVGCGCAYYAKLSLGSSVEVAADGFCVRFAFAFEVWEAGISGITSDFCQRWMLE